MPASLIEGNQLLSCVFIYALSLQNARAGLNCIVPIHNHRFRSSSFCVHAALWQMASAAEPQWRKGKRRGQKGLRRTNVDSVRTHSSFSLRTLHLIIGLYLCESYFDTFACSPNISAGLWAILQRVYMQAGSLCECYRRVVFVVMNEATPPSLA